MVMGSAAQGLPIESDGNVGRCSFGAYRLESIRFNLADLGRFYRPGSVQISCDAIGLLYIGTALCRVAVCTIHRYAAVLGECCSHGSVAVSFGV